MERERERRLVFNNNRCGSSTSGETSLNSVSVRVNGERIYRDRNRQSVEGGGSRRRGTKGGLIDEHSNVDNHGFEHGAPCTPYLGIYWRCAELRATCSRLLSFFPSRFSMALSESNRWPATVCTVTSLMTALCLNNVMSGADNGWSCAISFSPRHGVDTTDFLFILLGDHAFALTRVYRICAMVTCEKGRATAY